MIGLKELEAEMEGRKEQFDVLFDIAPQLVALVGADDADAIQSQLDEVAARYDRLGASCLACGRLLRDTAQGMHAFYDSTDGLANWLDDTERRLTDLAPLAAHPDLLKEQVTQVTVCVHFSLYPPPFFT